MVVKVRVLRRVKIVRVILKMMAIMMAVLLLTVVMVKTMVGEDNADYGDASSHRVLFRLV